MSKAPKSVCHQYHKIVLRRRVVTQRRRLIDSPLLQRLQLDHHLQHQHEDQTDLIAFQLEWTRCLLCLTPICSTPQTSLHTSRVRSRHYLLRSRTCPQTVVQIQSPTSSSLFGHSSQKGGENFEGEVAQLRGSMTQTLDTLVHTSVHCKQFSIIYVLV